jgi:spore maturation protein CgeB
MIKNKKLLLAAWACENKFYDSYQYWYCPLKRLFKNFVSFDPQKNILQKGRDQMNKDFLKLIEKEKPDYLFLWLMNDEFKLKTLAKIKDISPKTIILNFCGDDDIQFRNYSIYLSLFVDYNLVLPNFSLDKYKKLGMNIFPSAGKDMKRFRPLNIKKKYDVSFIGSYKADRYDYIKYLKESGINIALFGWGWSDYPEFADIYKGALEPEELVKVANQTKVNLCFTKSFLGKPHIVGRYFDISGCKSFTLVEKCPKFADFYKKNKEIIFFNNKEDLLKKIKYYLKNEKQREKIALNAYKRTIKDYDLNKELKTIFSKISKSHKINKHSLKINSKLRSRLFKITKENINSFTKDDLKEIDYIFFQTKGSKSLAFRELLQIFCFEKLKNNKPVSICDYQVYDKKLGILALSLTSMFSEQSNQKEFSSLLDINQIMITKEFFLKHLDKFKKFFKGYPINVINKDNSNFIAIPLVQTSKFPTKNYNLIKKAYHIRTTPNLSQFIYKKQLFTNPYLYRLLFRSFKDPALLKYLIEFSFNKHRIKNLFKIYKK